MPDNFLLDNIRQLKSGLICYVFKDSQAQEIKKVFEEETKIELKIEEYEDWYILKPTKKYHKYTLY